MTYSIKKLFHIKATRDKVFKAISGKEGLSSWWTTQVSGDGSPGGVLQFDFGEMQGPKMKIIELVPGEKVSWECVSSEHGWEGNRFYFLLDDHEGMTRVRFSHDGWNEQDDFYAACCFSWGRYMESLRQYCQTGTGEAFGSEGYRR